MGIFRRGSSSKQPAPATVQSEQRSPLLLDIVLPQDVLFDPANGAEVAAANATVAAEIAAGHHDQLPPVVRDWFMQNKAAPVSPTSAFGYTWYAHQDTLRMQLVHHEFLAATGYDQRDAQPGVQIWGNGSGGGARGGTEASGAPGASSAPQTPAAVSANPDLGMRAADLVAQWTNLSVISIMGTALPIVMPDPLHPSVEAVHIASESQVSYRFGNGDEVDYVDGFPVFDERLTATGGPACAARIVLDQALVGTTDPAVAIAQANTKFAEIIAAGEAGNAPTRLCEWASANADSATSPPADLGYIWRFHQNTGTMELVDRELLARAVNTSGFYLWGPGCWDPQAVEDTLAVPAPTVSATDAAADRKRRSEARLRELGVPVNEHLPVSPDAAAVPQRTALEIAQRAMCLMAVSLKAEVFGTGEHVEFQPIVEGLIADFEVAHVLSPKEVAFVADLDPDRTTAVQFVWRYEALWVLQWCLGFVPELDVPRAICDVPRTAGLMKEQGLDGLVAGASLRSADELLDEVDFIYRLHWAVRNARLGSSAPVEGIEAGVVMERHHALNWMIGYLDLPWDDVQTDT